MRHNTIFNLTLAALLWGGIAGCSNPSTIRVDGETTDWADGTWITSDAEWLYLRIAPDTPMTTLQSSATPTRVLIDTDNDQETGRKVSMMVRSIGAEHEVVLSPARADGSAGSGTAVFAYGEHGESRRAGHAELGFLFAPTYASGEYEMRLSRAGLGLTEGEVSVGIQHGSWERVGTAILGPAGEAKRASAIPTRELGTVRVMNWNVLWASPMENPKPFARVIKGLDADVLLLQEWSDTDDAAMNEWFADHAAQPNRRWQSVVQPGGSVAVVTRLPIVMRLDEAVELPGERGVRFVGAVIETGNGNALVGSVHLKCCGSYESSEDLRRRREAEAIGAYVRSITSRIEIQTVIIGGDFNLVGSRPPLDILAGGLDVDGSDLAISDPAVLGDSATYTWTDAESSFTPGRLDYLLVGDANAKIVRSFVFDSATIEPTHLEEAGIEGEDSRATDHLAVVVDVLMSPGE